MYVPLCVLCARVILWQVDYDGRCAVHIACKEGNHKVVEMLIQNDADVNIKDRWGQTPLQVAIIAKQQMIIGLLMACKAKLGIDDPGSALCTAAGDGDLPQVKRLIENGVDANKGDYDRCVCRSVL